MGKTLIIVESKPKGVTLQKNLGPGYIGAACNGHIQDLCKKNGIDVENNFKLKYVVMDGKGATIAILKKLAAECDQIYLAGDDDNEGMFINYSLKQHLKLENPKRLVYHDLSKSSLLKALKNPQEIDMNIVYAQQCRRVIDRLSGFELSTLLRKALSIFTASAGRVQSVVNRLIVEREEVIDSFYKKGADSYYRVTGFFDVEKFQVIQGVLHEITKKKKSKDKDVKDNTDKEETEEESNSDDEENKTKALNGELCKLGMNCEKQPSKDVKKFLKNCKKSDFTIHAIFNKTKISQPGAPFQTSSLQQEASTKLHFSPKRTMEIAQKLYEQGFITYMRTDSISLSKEWMDKIGEYVVDKYGKKYYNRKEWKGKDTATGGAHEAIRITNLDKTPNDDKFEAQKNVSVDDQKRLYGLIWKRTVASQMSAATFNVVHIQIVGSDIENYFFLTKLENLIFEGYLKVYGKDEDKKDEDVQKLNSELKLPKEGSIVAMKSILASQQYAKPIARYNEATLVSKMKQLGIGRPATYSSFAAKIIEREYVKLGNIEGTKMPCYTLQIYMDKDDIEENKKTVMMGKEIKRLYPTELGKTVNAFLISNFEEIMDYKFTAKTEKDLELIAEGKKEWKDVVKKFYDVFHVKIQKLMKKYEDGSKTVLSADDRLIGEEHGIKYVVGKRKHGFCVMKITEPEAIKNKSKDTDSDSNSESSDSDSSSESSNSDDSDEEEKTKKKGKKSKAIIQFAALEPPLKKDKITLKEAKQLFEYPKDLGMYKKKQVLLKKGPHGLYIAWNNSNFGLDNPGLKNKKKIVKSKSKNNSSSEEESDSEAENKTLDTTSTDSDSQVTLERAIEVIDELSKGMFVDDRFQYKILNGCYGPYISRKDLKKSSAKPDFVSLPKEFDMKSVDGLKLEDVKKLFDQALEFKKQSTGYHACKKAISHKKKTYKKS